MNGEWGVGNGVYDRVSSLSTPVAPLVLLVLLCSPAPSAPLLPLPYGWVKDE